MKISFLKGFRERVMMATYIIPKWTDDSSMKNMVMRSIGAELNDPIERFLVLKPPVAVTLMAWLMASKGLIPASRYIRKEATAIPK